MRSNIETVVVVENNKAECKCGQIVNALETCVGVYVDKSFNSMPR